MAQTRGESERKRGRLERCVWERATVMRKTLVKTRDEKSEADDNRVLLTVVM